MILVVGLRIACAVVIRNAILRHKGVTMLPTVTGFVRVGRSDNLVTRSTTGRNGGHENASPGRREPGNQK